MKKFIIVLFCGLLLDVLIWIEIFAEPAADPSIHFLDVGQGDAQLLSLDGIKMLVDTGPDTGILRELGSSLPRTNGRIDLVVITHAERDHFGGLAAILGKYEVGAVLWNGRDPDGSANEWQVLRAELTKRHIPLFRLRAGDRLALGKSAESLILSPDLKLLSGADLNDGSVVQLLRVGKASILLTGDVGFAGEERMISAELPAVDIIKIAHHGSKNSTGQDLLRAITPSLAVIQVGENGYGHPSLETLSRLTTVDNILRTDKNGTIRIDLLPEGLRIFTEK